MKLINYNIAFLLVLIPLLSFSNGPLRGKYKKTKEVSKSFEVNSNTILNIKNKYGNVDITTWNRNQIEIEVTITVSGNDEDEVETKLDKIRINFEENGNDVYATTNVGKSKSKSWFSSNWFSWGNNSSINYQIDYRVKMPIENNLNITNDYGSIILDELNGKANIHCDFGKLTIGSLNNTHNEIHFDYTKHSNFEFINKAEIYADFSGFTLEKANEIKLEADYSSSNIEHVNKLNYACDFGSLTVGSVSFLEGNGDYSSLRFGEIYKTADVNTSFGSLKIEKLIKGFESAKIKADYTGVKIGIDSNASCSINSQLSFGNFKYDGDLFTFNKIREKHTNKSYEGYFNNEETNASITTDTEFGSIKFYQR
jgi:hypothetical protein